jgi:chemotaxis protein methyltransferase CheR
MSPRASSNSTALAEGHPLTEDQFHRAREWIYRRTGMLFGDNKQYFVDTRVTACVRQHGGDFETWFGNLRLGIHAGWAQELINEITINETYFLREDCQFDDLVTILLPGILAERRASRSRDPIRILSLPCSTGEEAYSIGFKVIDEWPSLANVDVQIIGADIDTRVLETARAGEYGSRSLHRVPEQLRSRWFDPLGGQRYRVKKDLRDVIEFVHTNVSDHESMRSFRWFDVIFCRNLLIYFDQLSSRRAAENLFGALRPGGHLVIGRSESMSRISSTFQATRLPDGIAYQRPASEGAS